MDIPKEVESIVRKLQEKNFQAFIVGGCVRDLLRKVKPHDWDVSTGAKPEEIAKIFPKNYIDNKFGTVKVLTGSKDPTLREIEITTFRTEERYTDKRHPDTVRWAKTIEEDLSRRDFTVNALALTEVKTQKPESKAYEIIDPFGGEEDLKSRRIRAVGKANDRLKEDALRLMRAVRFATVLDFNIESKTYEAVKENAGLLEFISNERIRDELIKIVMSDDASKGIESLREVGLLRYVIPELLEGYGVSQNKHHIYGVYEHSLRSLAYGAKKNYNMHVRFAALLHDIGKPRTKEGEGPNSTFYNHEIVGARMTAQLLNRLRFSKKDIEKIVKLVRFHLFYYNVDEVTESSVRKLVRRVGMENIEELIQVRACDRIGSGCPKAIPYKLRHLLYVVEKISLDPIDVTRLEMDGNRIMELLKLGPGPKIGKVLNILLSDVLDEPDKNKKDYLEKKVKELGRLTDDDLDRVAKEAKIKVNEIIEKRDEMTKKKYWVS